jgi:hypothetical protein
MLGSVQFEFNTVITTMGPRSPIIWLSIPVAGMEKYSHGGFSD